MPQDKFKITAEHYSLAELAGHIYIDKAEWVELFDNQRFPNAIKVIITNKFRKIDEVLTNLGMMQKMIADALSSVTFDLDQESSAIKPALALGRTSLSIQLNLQQKYDDRADCLMSALDALKTTRMEIIGFLAVRSVIETRQVDSSAAKRQRVTGHDREHRFLPMFDSTADAVLSALIVNSMARFDEDIELATQTLAAEPIPSSNDDTSVDDDAAITSHAENEGLRGNVNSRLSV